MISDIKLAIKVSGKELKCNLRGFRINIFLLKVVVTEWHGDYVREYPILIGIGISIGIDECEYCSEILSATQTSLCLNWAYSNSSLTRLPFSLKPQNTSIRMIGFAATFTVHILRVGGDIDENGEFGKFAGSGVEYNT